MWSGTLWRCQASHTIFFEEAYEIYIKNVLGGIALMYIFKRF